MSPPVLCRNPYHFILIDCVGGADLTFLLESGDSEKKKLDANKKNGLRTANVTVSAKC